ncbi:hypothetical protein [Sphingobacterium sp. SYP-B4668]|uniref:hypothetical protein n=1 Tax=Sphingobacterium sp. SYP-B4668 TaxID=2996035 RepID=UPI0022DE4DBA|nr:hypothetical protein [Sphingobacterium sp. SYP-B4668]
MKKKLFIPFLSVLFLAVVSCKSENPFPKPQPEPEPYVEHPCAKAGDIYKIFPDTVFVNKDGLYFKFEDKLQRLYYDVESSTSFALFTCEGKFDDRNKAANSPLSWEIKRVEQEKRDTVYATQGAIPINKLLLPKDVDKILTFGDGEKMEYGVSLLNFNRDTIQAGTITFIAKKDLKL